VQVRLFIERCPHSASVEEAGEAALAPFTFADRTARLADVEAAVDPSDLSPYRASRIARIAASLLIMHSPEEL
jgi:hypothetical protein